MQLEETEKYPPKPVRVFSPAHFYILLVIWFCWLMIAAAHNLFSMVSFLPRKGLVVLITMLGPLFGPLTGPLIGGWNTWGGKAAVSALPFMFLIAMAFILPQLIRTHVGSKFHIFKLTLWALGLIFWTMCAFGSILAQLD